MRAFVVVNEGATNKVAHHVVHETPPNPHPPPERFTRERRGGAPLLPRVPPAVATPPPPISTARTDHRHGWCVQVDREAQAFKGIAHGVLQVTEDRLLLAVAA